MHCSLGDFYHLHIFIWLALIREVAIINVVLYYEFVKLLFLG